MALHGLDSEVKSRNTLTASIPTKGQPSYKSASREIDRTKQGSAIAPNIIHSLDAAAMMLTVQAALDEGINHFACVHDSFGTYAADTPTLARITREQFVQMYSSDVLG